MCTFLIISYMLFMELPTEFQFSNFPSQIHFLNQYLQFQLICFFYFYFHFIRVILQQLNQIVIKNMFKQLQNMYGIEQEDNQSNTQEQIPLTMSNQTISKLRLVKIGAQQQFDDEKQLHELDLDDYLQTQRSNMTKIKPKPKTQEQIQKQKQFKAGYGVGFKMLQKMGFNVTKGLGKNEQGRTNIVEAQFKTALTTRDQQYQEEQQRIQRQKQEEEEQKQEINPYNQNKFEQLFLYRSKASSINNLLLTLKNKYEVYRVKLDLITKQTQSFGKDMEISENLRVQKINQVKEIDEEIQGLQKIQKSTNNIELYPHLAISYNADLLIIKQSIDRLQNVRLSKLINVLRQEINKTRHTLRSLYLAKERETLKQYNQTTGFQLKMHNYIQKSVSKNKNKKQSEINKKHTDKNAPVEQPMCLSPQDEQKINKYLKIIIDECVMKDKLEVYLEKLRDFSECEEVILDIMDIIASCSPELVMEIKQKYLIPKANFYLSTWKYDKSVKKLPHLVIFPWMLIMKLEQLNVNRFLQNLMSKIWPIQTDQLYNLIQPWLKYIKNEDKYFFFHFYMAPRLLNQMEQFSLTLNNSNQKQKLKGFLKYCQLIPGYLRSQIIQNSLALTILSKYKTQRKQFQASVTNLQQKQVSIKELNNWALKWSQKMNKICPGIIQKVFQENGVQLFSSNRP